jgi:hypothetical protein
MPLAGHIDTASPQQSTNPDPRLDAPPAVTPRNNILTKLTYPPATPTIAMSGGASSTLLSARTAIS